MINVTGVIENKYTDHSMFQEKDKLPIERVHGYAKYTWAVLFGVH